jgi:hypothetical protein
MTMREAQTLAVSLNDKGYTAWAVQGFSVKLTINGVVYEIKEADERS